MSAFGSEADIQCSDRVFLLLTQSGRAAAANYGKPAPTGVEMILKTGRALLIGFAATLVLVHAEVYFVQSPIMFLISNCLD